MKYCYIVVLVFLFAIKGFGQPYSNFVGGNIPDNNTLTFYPVTVSGLPSLIDSTTFGLLSVCVTITHPYVGQLDIYIKSPNGTLIKLVNNRGGNGQNFSNSCFEEDGAFPVSVGVAPFLGTYVPEQSINLENIGQNPNGIWYLGVIDEIPNSSGKVNKFTITFGSNPPHTPLITACSLSNGSACKCPDGTQNCDLLPDMTNSTKVITNNYYDEPGIVHIGVGTPNIGYGPLEMRGTGICYCDTVPVSDCSAPCADGSYPKETVMQRVYHKSGSTITFNDRLAGHMTYHPTHTHVHIDDWTYNTLRIKGPNPDPKTWPILGHDSKISFCLVNNYNCSASLGYCLNSNGTTATYESAGNPGLGAVSGCSRQQGIYPGDLDIYFPGYDGQELHVGDSLCNGWYYVVSITDPNNDVLEIDKTNNVAVAPVFLAFQQTTTCCHAGFSADTLIGDAPFTVHFADTTKPSSDSWHWNFGDGITDTTQFPTHIYTKNGNYSVSLKTHGKDVGCTDSITKASYIKVRSIEKSNDSNNVRIYPNPFNDRFTAYYHIAEAEKVDIAIYDVFGRKVFDRNYGTQNQGAYETSVTNIPVLAKGTYIIKVSLGNSVQYRKVVKG